MTYAAISAMHGHESEWLQQSIVERDGDQASVGVVGAQYIRAYREDVFEYILKGIVCRCLSVQASSTQDSVHLYSAPEHAYTILLMNGKLNSRLAHEVPQQLVYIP